MSVFKYISPKTVQIVNGTTIADVVAHEGETSLRVVEGHKASFFIHLDASAIVATTAFMLIDLSDTGNWPHTNTDHIVLEWLTINVDPATAYRGDVEIGFLSSVDATDGDFNKIHSFHFDQAGGTGMSIGVPHPGGVDLEAAEWFGPTSANDVLFQTDVNLLGPDGTTAFPSGDGDMVMKITRTAGTVDVGIAIGYTTVA